MTSCNNYVSHAQQMYVYIMQLLVSHDHNYHNINSNSCLEHCAPVVCDSVHARMLSYTVRALMLRAGEREVRWMQYKLNPIITKIEEQISLSIILCNI